VFREAPHGSEEGRAITTPKSPEPVTLIVGMLAREPALFDAAEQRLVECYGAVDVASPILDFDCTDYYEPEMGPGLKRKFIGLARKIDPGEIAAIKLATNALEGELAPLDRSVPRPINLDPGYICGSKLVLASAKDRSQRIYVGRGIYVEITLEFRQGRFQTVPTTYRDYASDAYIAFFTEVRERHLHSRGD